MREVERVEIAAGARSLAWVAGDLYNIAAGWRRFPLDGSKPESRYSGYGSGFDAATVSPRADVVALVCSTGTKGLLLRTDGGVLRELNRSYYHAEAYRYPLALFTLPDGRTGVVHCPARYNRLEIEDAITGQSLTVSDEREPADLFHSRLAVSGSGRYLLSAGWFWHPWDCLMVYDLARALVSPDVLDSRGDVDHRGLARAQVSSACFIGDDITVSTSAESADPQEPGDLAPGTLARWSTAERRFVWKRQLDQTAGDVLPMAGGVLAVYHHPRLYDAGTGELVFEWPDLTTGEADSSIVWDKAFSGPARIAIDEPNHRFAVTDGQRITVVTWSGSLNT